MKYTCEYIFLGIHIRNYCYSEAQSGKSYCDAKIAHMRTKMKTYVASGKDILSAEDMEAGIDHMHGKGTFLNLYTVHRVFLV